MSKSFLSKQNYIKELTIPEHIILGLNVLTSTVFFILQLVLYKAYGNGTTGLSFIATVLSIFSVMAGAKKRILCPFLGIIASILLVAISGSQVVYGSMIMYGFNIIVQVVSLITWIKSSKNKVSIEPKDVKGGICIIYLAILIGLTVLFTGIEGIDGFNKFGSGGKQDKANILPIRIFDSIVLIFTIGTFIPMIKRYKQVGGVYIIVDLGIAILGLLKAIYKTDDTNQLIALSMTCSGFSMLATSILGLISGNKTSKKNKK